MTYFFSIFYVKLQVQWNDKHGGYGKHFFEYNHADGYFPLQSGAKPGDSGDFPEKFRSRTIRRLWFLFWSDFCFLFHKRNLVKTLQSTSDDFPERIKRRCSQCHPNEFGAKSSDNNGDFFEQFLFYLTSALTLISELLWKHCCHFNSNVFGAKTTAAEQ